MAGTITGGIKRNPTFQEGSTNEVISVTELKHYAVKYTDSDSKVTMAVIARFGKFADGQPALFLEADAKSMEKTLSKLPAWMQKGVLEKIGELSNDVDMDKVPDPLGAVPRKPRVAARRGR